MRLESGFTIVELMIGIAILAFMMGVAVPNFTIWIQNLQIRAGAEGILSGLQVARTEAVRRNVNVQLALTSPPQTGWAVSVPATGETVQSRPASEGAANAIVNIAGGGTTVTFNGLGRRVNNADASPLIDQIDVDSSVLAAADSRELRIVIGTGGTIRLCEPAVASGDPRAC